jgi:hypothetical protein
VGLEALAKDERGRSDQRADHKTVPGTETWPVRWLRLVKPGRVSRHTHSFPNNCCMSKLLEGISQGSRLASIGTGRCQAPALCF